MWGGKEREKETWTGEGKCWRIRKYEKEQKNGSSVKNSRVRNGAWRRERWNRKWGREREGWSNAFWQRWVQDGFMVTSWLIFEESIDRRAVHLSLDTHVGEQAESSCAGTHAGSRVDSLWMHPKICTESAHSSFYFLLLSLSPSLFPFSFFCSKKEEAFGSLSFCSKLCAHLFLLEEYIVVYALRSLTHTFLFCHE